MKAIASAIQSTNRTEIQTYLPPRVAFMSNSALKFILVGFTIVIATSSCVPLAIGAAGVAVGYIAREEGVGVVEPASSTSSEPTYDSSEAPVY